MPLVKSFYHIRFIPLHDYGAIFITVTQDTLDELYRQNTELQAFKIHIQKTEFIRTKSKLITIKHIKALFPKLNLKSK